MVVFLVLTQLAIDLPTTTAVVTIESSYNAQTCSVSDETADYLNSTSQDNFDRLPTAQMAIPSDNAPVLLPSSKGIENVTIPLQPSVPATVMASKNTMDERIDTQGEPLKTDMNDHQRHSTLVF